jgi:hypothetical protein
LYVVSAAETIARVANNRGEEEKRRKHNDPAQTPDPMH